MEFTGEILNSLQPHLVMSLAKDYDPDAIDHIVRFYNVNRRYERGVLNAILLICIKYKKGHLPNKDYLDKTLNSWKDKKRMTSYRAAQQLNNHAAWKSENKVPEWLNVYIKELEEMEG